MRSYAGELLRCLEGRCRPGGVDRAVPGRQFNDLDRGIFRHHDFIVGDESALAKTYAILTAAERKAAMRKLA
jgi:hypothetical protein